MHSFGHFGHTRRCLSHITRAGEATGRIEAAQMMLRVREQALLCLDAANGLLLRSTYPESNAKIDSNVEVAAGNHTRDPHLAGCVATARLRTINGPTWCKNAAQPSGRECPFFVFLPCERKTPMKINFPKSVPPTSHINQIARHKRFHNISVTFETFDNSGVWAA